MKTVRRKIFQKNWMQVWFASVFAPSSAASGSPFEGTLSQNIFILKTGHLGNINSLNICGLNKFFFRNLALIII